MANILDKILDTKKQEVLLIKDNEPMDVLQEKISKQDRAQNFVGALLGDDVRLIAEIKPASPVKGEFIAGRFNINQLADIYASNGAAAISVLTDKKYFQGDIEYLMKVKGIVGARSIPVLRKDFIIDLHQIYQSRAYGADAILLIVAANDKTKLTEMIHLCSELWMQAVVEVHSEDELEIALEAGAEIIGINNRNLETFIVDLQVTEKLASLIPENKVIVSESGIRTRADIDYLAKHGVNAVLVGEALVSSEDPAMVLRSLL
ncbi:MAG: indole-3-glycerol phosphate synthase TrpC [SAR202 cluster bacterium]|nr:indole-3-glycerol phosphate synthase TrpC [SAR202 cluster bacterium]